MDTRCWHCPRDSFLCCSLLVHPSLDSHHQVLLETLGASIARLRRLRGYSQERLAEESGVSRNTVSLIETGKCDLKVVTVTVLFRALQIGVLRINPRTYEVECEGGVCFTSQFPSELVGPSIGLAIDVLRQQHGLSRESLSVLSGVHRNTIGRIENGIGETRVTTLHDLYHAFGVSESHMGPLPCGFDGPAPFEELYEIAVPNAPAMHLLSFR